LEHGTGAEERRDACLAAEGGMREESLRQSPFMCSRRFFSTSFLSILHPPLRVVPSPAAALLFIFPDWRLPEERYGGTRSGFRRRVYELWRLDGVLLIYTGEGRLLAWRMDDAEQCGSGGKMSPPAISAVRCRRIDGRIPPSTPSARVAMRVGPTRADYSFTHVCAWPFLVFFVKKSFFLVPEMR
jgi:hypothetical protein